MNVSDVQSIVGAAIGGDNMARRSGSAALPINVRYPREVRDSVEGAACRSSRRGAQIRLGDVAAIRVTDGPPMLKGERAAFGWVYVDIRTTCVPPFATCSRRCRRT
jgi:Cu(I)/Ag(I) efflux system membrane protein CusA/SilA